MFDLIFISLFVVGWALTAMIPWVVLSVATKGRAGLWFLPFCVFVGVVAGLAIPILGRDDVAGIWLSFGAALVFPAALLAARRFSLGQPVPGREQRESPE